MGNSESQTSFLTQKSQKLIQTAKTSEKSTNRLISKGSIAIEDDSLQFLDKLDLTARTINPQEYVFPFENLVFAGGRMNCLAYCGCLEYLELSGCLHTIKRIAGTGYGAFIGTLVCVGFTWQEISKILSQDVSSILKGGVLGSLLPDVIRGYGISSIGEDVFNKMGKLLHTKTGNPDLTFKQLFDSFGKELCVIATNLNHMKVDYLHIKTTPDMPIRSAVQMAMTIPGFYCPRVQSKDNNDFVNTDGSLLYNYPINSFDGWFLSLNHEDSFVLKLPTLKDYHSDNEKAFDKINSKTLGFLVYSDIDTHCLKDKLESRLGVLIPPKPCEETASYKRNQTELQEEIEMESLYSKTKTVTEKFMKILNQLPMEIIDKKDLKETFINSSFTQGDVNILFGADTDIKLVFEKLDYERKGLVSRKHLIETVEDKAREITKIYDVKNKTEISSFATFMFALEATVKRSQKLKECDIERTVGINSGHIELNDKAFCAADQQFLIERGYNSTRAFLQYYVAKHKPRKKLLSQTAIEEEL